LDRQLYGGLAQLGEHLLCKQGVVGSIPSSSTITSLVCEVQTSRSWQLFLGIEVCSLFCCSLTIRRVEISVADGKLSILRKGAGGTVPSATLLIASTDIQLLPDMNDRHNAKLHA
jgi:hypothetical protein